MFVGVFANLNQHVLCKVEVLGNLENFGLVLSGVTCHPLQHIMFVTGLMNDVFVW